jgi:hypothetical protein
MPGISYVDGGISTRLWFVDDRYTNAWTLNAEPDRNYEDAHTQSDHSPLAVAEYNGPPACFGVNDARLLLPFVY